MTTLSEQIKEVKREIDLRKRVYPKWVLAGKMKQIEADYHIDVMECILNTLVVLNKFQLDIISKNKENIK